MRTPFIIGNWKMHGTTTEGRARATGIRVGLTSRLEADVALCPPYTALSVVATALAGSPLALGAQNCHYDAAGAHTGEISPLMLVDLGVRIVLLGHSERRHEQGETDDLINRKVRAVLAHNVTPVLCVGETDEERRQGLTFTTIEGQLRAGLAGVPAEAMTRVVLAYEPVWAIGTGVNATPTQAAEVHGYLRGLLSELASKEIAQAVRILYGGSVKTDNAEALVAQAEIDGALVGGASLNVQSFLAIVTHAARASGGLEGD